MPCPICGHIRVELRNHTTCPKCANLKILDSITASIVACRREKIIRKLWKQELDKIDQSSLLLHVFRDREFVARDFWKKLGLIDIDQLFSDTLFLKRVMQDGNPNGAIVIDSVQKAKPIIDLFTSTKRVETDSVLINSCYALMSYEREFDLNTISDNDVLANFSIHPTEDHLKLKRSYENYSLYTRDEAEKKFKEYAEEYEKIKQQKITPINHTREQFIRRNYDMISNLYLALLRNEIYADVFDTRILAQLTNDPSNIMRFINETFPRHDTALTEDDTDPFLNRCRKFFRKSLPVVRKILLFEQENPDVFPLFLRIKWTRDSVFLSQAFIAIMYILLHAVITKDLFDIESSKRGKMFEDKIKARFEELGFKFLPNVKDKPVNHTLEIDGIAIKDDYCFVIEDKNYRLPPIVESSETKKIMIDDLKGIVDGYKRTTVNGQRVEKQVKSLPEKMEFVKNNLNVFGLDAVSKDKIFGLIVTQNYPLLSNYKRIKIIWGSEITNEKLKI